MAVQMPILDGSGQVWVENIAACGLRPAHKPDTPDLLERKQAWRPNVPISVFDHDSFVTLYPAGFFRRITAGVEFQDVPVIGSQWISFEAQAADNPVRPFATEFAPARTWVSSPEYAYAMRDAGYLAAGTPDCVLVADQDNWRDSASPATHALHACSRDAPPHSRRCLSFPAAPPGLPTEVHAAALCPPALAHARQAAADAAVCAMQRWTCASRRMSRRGIR